MLTVGLQSIAARLYLYNLLAKINYLVSKCKNNCNFACILIINVYLCTQFKHKLLEWDK